MAVRIGSRSGAPPFDWDDRGTWDGALRGASAAYVSYYPDLAVPGAAELIGALADHAVAAGTRRLVLPAGDVREPFVDVEDIADVAVAALAEDGHAGRLYELTGPRLPTFAEAVAEIGRATGRELRYVPIELDAFEAGLAAEDVPTDVIGLLRYLFTEALDGRNEQLADGVQRALGREPHDFAAYARRAAAEGAWSPSVAA